MLPAQPNQSLIDGIDVLQAVVATGRPPGTRELARELGIEPTRISRLLRTLAHLGLTQQTADRKDQPGPAIHVLAAQSLFGSKLLRRALPHLEALHDHGLVVAMGVLWRQWVCYLYHAQPGMSAVEALGRAGLYPAERSGIGMALLARQSPPQADLPPTVRRKLAHIRQEGFALVESVHGRRSLGVALPGDSAAAIALSGRIDRRRLPRLVRSLQHTASCIARDAASAGSTERATDD